MFCGEQFLILLFLTRIALSACPSDVPHFAETVMQRSLFAHSTWRMNISYVNDEDRLVSVYSHQSDRFGIPASNNKVLTTVAAYNVLGPDFVTKTTVSLLPPSTLCLTAAGDATLSHTQLAYLAKYLQANLPIRDLNLVVDDSLFGSQDVPDGWEWADMWFDYGAPPTPSVLEHNTISLIVNAGAKQGSSAKITSVFTQDEGTIEISNSIVTGAATSSPSISYSYRLRDAATLILEGSIPLNSAPIALDPIAVHLPALRLGKAFANHLAGYKINIHNVSTTTTPLCSQTHQHPQELSVYVNSPPLAVIMNHTLQTSDNLEAELFMRLLGARSPSNGISNYELGKKAVKDALSQLKVDTAKFYQIDGSGLSSGNLIQPDAEIEVLYQMRNQKQYMSFLPVGGESGTLRNRCVVLPLFCASFSCVVVVCLFLCIA